MEYSKKSVLFKEKTINVLSLLLLGILMGVVGGIVGAVFVKSIAFVTKIRSLYSWVLLFLPLGAILVISIYKYCKTTGVGTVNVIESVNNSEKNVPKLLSVSVFFGTVISHLFGASVGREGAALQLGGSVAKTLGYVFKLNKKMLKTLTLCGMSALFSALFGTPIGALVFVFEITCFKLIFTFAVIPVAVSSFVAYFVAGIMKVVPERYAFEFSGLNYKTLINVIIISVVGALASVAFCWALRLFEKLFNKLFVNAYLRAVVGAMVIVILTLAIKTTDYNGGGIEVINRIFNKGTVKNEAFLLKILFTSISIASGFKGGEIVPTLFVGATLGGTFSNVLRIQMPLGTAVGMVSLFAGVTNCPLTAIVLGLEFFNGKAAVCCVLAATVSYLLSGKISIYSQKQNKE